MSGPAPLLEIRDLRIGFEAKKDVVDGIGLEVPRRSFSCLVGESGSGKTLTGLSVLGLCRGARVSGKILWQEATRSVDLLSLPEESMRKYRGKKIAFIFQDPASSLNPVKKIGVQLGEVFRLEGPRPDKEIQRETLKLLARVHFPDPQRIYSSFPHELSGGMRQRVLIALAIARGPELLIADEPTTALDAPLEKEILLLVRELQLLMGLTILWITHDMSIAVTMADRMTVMRHGYIVETLLRTQGGFEPQDAYSQALLTASLWRGAPKSPIEVANV